VGVQQKGGGRFIHLDIRNGELTGPTVWSYWSLGSCLLVRSTGLPRACAL
jgi:hypothetical protein